MTLKEHGKIRVSIEMLDFHGWTADVLWQDTKFHAKHFSDIERVAMVGETKLNQVAACNGCVLQTIHGRHGSLL
ncbi:MAG TPA: STAS/SEC14 domain-containing protein [Verrucomicrobiae bacterium]|nr:STAS/SEC14 domain-containing protein [Verrucomicrobiae bacterium]